MPLIRKVIMKQDNLCKITLNNDNSLHKKGGDEYGC